MKNLLLIIAGGALLIACEKPPVAQKAEAAATAPVAKAEGKEYQIDVAKSSVAWIGTKKIGKHNGTIALKSGSVFVKNGAIVAGKFIADMKTIDDKDLTGENHAKLVKHLKSPDFFDVEQFPEGIFEITSVSGKTINGNLTLKGKPYGISFEADVVFEKEAPRSAKTSFNIDRTKWGIVYPGMPDNLINDTINLTLDLKIKK
ncbi:MAG: YceI family protein [Leptospiraceae bacterium]|nr:YceI family protein [Leptospiraceae bacterium]